jgi:hypothetical protein
LQERGVSQYNASVVANQYKVAAEKDEEDPDELANEYLDAYATNRIMFGDPGTPLS